MANTISGLGTAVVSFVVLAIILGIGGVILDNVAEEQCTSDGYYWNTTATNGGECEYNSSDTGAVAVRSIEFNATHGGLEGVSTFGEWLPTIAVILASALVIGIVASYFYFRG